MPLTADALQLEYGTELAEGPLSQCTSAHYLHKALTEKGIDITIGAVKQWWTNHRLPPGAMRIQTANDLQEQHGSSIAHLVAEHGTPYKLCKALLKLDPPLFVTNEVAKQWLLKYAGHENLTTVHNAGHLETWYGDRIRAEMPEGTVAGGDLARWLPAALSVSANARVCQKWLSTHWSSSGVLLAPEDVEDCLGDRLRLQQYRDRFCDDESAR